MDSETLSIYLEEANELLEKMERGIAQLESNFNDQDAIQSIFLSLHTLKGNTGFAGLETEFKIFSCFTDFFRPIHGKKENATPKTIEMLKKFLPIIKKVIEQIKNGVSMEEAKASEIIQNLGLTLA